MNSSFLSARSNRPKTVWVFDSVTADSNKYESVVVPVLAALRPHARVVCQLLTPRARLYMTEAVVRFTFTSGSSASGLSMWPRLTCIDQSGVGLYDRRTDAESSLPVSML